MGFVHDDEGLAPLAEVVEAGFDHGQAGFLFPQPLVRLADVEQQRLQQVDAVGEVAGRHEDGTDVVRLVFEQPAGEQGLADAGRAGQEQDRLVVVQPLAQVGEGLLVAGSRVVGFGVGRGAERPAAQAEAAEVHGAATFPDGRCAGRRSPNIGYRPAGHRT